VVPLLEVVLERAEQRVLEVEDPIAVLADGVLMVLTGDLVVGGAGAEAHRPERSRDRERLESPVDGGPGEAGAYRLDPRGDLVGGAV